MARCAGKQSGATLSTAAAIHVGRGGFSRRYSPFMRGTIQSPLSTISRAVSRLRVSMMSGRSAPELTKNAMKHSNASSKASR